MRKLLFGILFTGILFTAVSEAVPTKVIVRAKAKDAKFIGTSMGGALVILRDSDTGEVLAKGFTVGGTGNTKRIMMEPVKRGTQLSDERTARFETTVDIDEPRFVTVEVYGPYAQKQSLIKSTTQVWLIPGKDIVGDGIVVEMPGFVVDVMTPQAHEKIKMSGKRLSIPVRANIVMT